MAPRLAARTFIATNPPVKAAIALAKRDCVSRAGIGHGIDEVCVHAGELRKYSRAPHHDLRDGNDVRNKNDCDDANGKRGEVELFFRGRLYAMGSGTSRKTA